MVTEISTASVTASYICSHSNQQKTIQNKRQFKQPPLVNFNYSVLMLPQLLTLSHLDKKENRVVKRLLCCGSPNWARTSDIMINSHALYRLSYGGIQSKTPVWVYALCWHLPIFPGRHQPSIFGTTELNFCVRYGNRWTLSVINTNLLTFVSLLRTVLIILRAVPNVNTFLKKF